MSAWLLSKSEIDVLVHWMYKMGTVQLRTLPDNLGAELWAANYKSIRARYGDWDWHNEKYVKRPHYAYATPTHEFYKTDMNQAAKMCRFYEYQTCEFEGYYQSRAHKLVSKLYDSLIAHGADPQAEGLTWGYNPAKIAAEAKAEKITAYYEEKANA